MTTVIINNERYVPPPLEPIGGRRGSIGFWKRFLYFAFIGWWLGLLWIMLAYGICLTIIGMPLAMWMFDLVPLLVSLQGV